MVKSPCQPSHYLLLMSNKTRERILTATLALFNEKGLSQTPTRVITQHVDISQGHLTYYFPKRTDILNALYRHYQDQLVVILATPTENSGKYEFFAWLDALLEINYTFRFLFLDFAQVMRESPTFKADYLSLRHLRKQRFREFMQVLSPNTNSELVYQQVELILEFGMLYEVMEGKVEKKELMAKLKKNIKGLFL